MNIFDWSGPDFLALYLALIVFCTVGSVLLRWFGRTPIDNMGVLPALDPFEVAYLAGGRKRAINSAILSLANRSLIQVKSDGRIKILQPLQRIAGTLEKKVYDAIGAGYDTLARLREIVEVPIKGMEQNQLLVTGSFPTARIVPVLIMMSLLAVGVIKIGIGIDRNRPVGYLFVLCLIVVGITVFFIRPVVRSVRGDRVLDAIRVRNSALETSGRSAFDRLGPFDMALAVGLFGLHLADGSTIASTAQILDPPRQRDSSTSHSSCGSSSCGSSSCSSGGSSCGGGCGGGCGGCGGGA